MPTYRLAGTSDTDTELRSKFSSTTMPERRAYLDYQAVTGLNRLVSGPLTSLNQLNGAEQALRAILFHDSVEHAQPGVLVKVLSQNGERHTGYCKGLDEPDIDAIRDMLTHLHYKSNIAIIEHLYTFTDRETERALIAKQSALRHEVLHREEEHRNQGGQRPYIVFDAARGYFERVSDNVDSYRDECFRKSNILISRYLADLTFSCTPGYFGDPLYKRMYEYSFSYPHREKIFGSLDRGWRRALEELAHFDVSLPIGFATALCLDKAENREKIPETILYVREDMRPFRENLWRNLNDIFSRSAFSNDQIRQVKTVVQDAERLIPEAFKSGEF